MHRLDVDKQDNTQSKINKLFQESGNSLIEDLNQIMVWPHTDSYAPGDKIEEDE